MRAMLMGFEEAANTIGNALINLGSDDMFDNRRFHYPGISRDAIVYTPGKVAVLCEWEGIASDQESEREGVVVPAAFRYELRLLHPTYANDPSVSDADVYAKQQILRASGLWFEAMARDRTLGDLLFDVAVEASFTGPLQDEITGDEFRGHQMTLITVLFIR